MMGLTNGLSVKFNRHDIVFSGFSLFIRRSRKKYKYLPEGMEDAISIVIGQGEQWSSSMSD